MADQTMPSQQRHDYEDRQNRRLTLTKTGVVALCILVLTVVATTLIEFGGLDELSDPERSGYLLGKLVGSLLIPGLIA